MTELFLRAIFADNLVLSYFLAKSQNESPFAIIGEHLGIAALVVVFSHYIGVWVAITFG